NVSCSNCHATRSADSLNTKPEKLDEFHQGLQVDHGNVACLSCHNSENYDTLKLANGQAVDFQNVMQLCAQCHGAKASDYAHGAHGGMTGHWDLSRGPRQRNSCVDCHDPHSPGFPAMKPTFKPRDRFLESTTHHGEHFNE
ncbi:MAG: nitrate reductase cytochrome c-type subunit, partial [Pirellulaceae bacterium]